ncbi:hypothetical protein FF1_013977 [Malus domestica]
MTARRKMLQNSADGFSKIVDLLSRFAIHHMNVGYSRRKVAARVDVNSASMTSLIDAIRSVYMGCQLLSLMKVDASGKDSSSSVFKIDGFISDSNDFEY